MSGKATPRAMHLLRSLEWILLTSGVILVCSYAAMRLYSFVAAHVVMAAFQQGSASLFSAHSDSDMAGGAAGINTSLWSDKRIHAYNASLSHAFGTPLALLSIPKIHLEVPVFDGTDDLTLDRGVGRIVGTAHPGQPGNLGIAGHRDGFFRGLKDVAPGDEIKLVFPDAEATYVVDQITVVTPQDVSVLQPGPISSITLVTCFPFYFVGSAPERYIVSASLRADAQPAVRGFVRPNP
ncbi:class D sortase [Edaphobacter modestus]|uniref:Sortase A n=1 Tax=Edaphobacter modestus TaxID=388466 RepID=A0A4V2G4J7_9BACT|nr:class D sortase [Edaphobacter modestus]RZU41166.1 sortase A [Edaphobacter modestus]